MKMKLLSAALLALAPPGFAAELPRADAVFATPDAASVELGWLLFYDPILSGNQTVACATCHHPRFGTSDGVSLSIGDGGIGLGPERLVDTRNPPEARVPRNAPALFNLGAAEFTVMFHDGRLEADAGKPNGIRTPLGDDMAEGFKNVLSAQAMFPVLAADEMAGHYSENDVAQAVRRGQLTQAGGAWDIIAKRVEALPEYRHRFEAVLGQTRALHFTDIANAIADFTAAEWRADDSAFDRHLRGEAQLFGPALVGMELFYGAAGCASCHSGQFQTDQAFHAIAMPQIGPGKAAPFENHSRDTGRLRVTGRQVDAYKFRTPSLRNLSVTAPYGHDGAYLELTEVIQHHLDPERELTNYSISQARLLPLEGAVDQAVLEDAGEMRAIAQANELPPVDLTSAEMEEILAFLASLEDPVALAGRLGVPKSVPSGLPVDR